MKSLPSTFVRVGYGDIVRIGKLHEVLFDKRYAALKQRKHSVPKVEALLFGKRFKKTGEKSNRIYLCSTNRTLSIASTYFCSYEVRNIQQPPTHFPFEYTS